MSATIKDNIVFNYEYDEDFYNLVLDGIVTYRVIASNYAQYLFRSMRFAARSGTHA